MNCPMCNVELRVSDRQGIEIDYCPQCGGIWLDHDELEKIIDRFMCDPEANGGNVHEEHTHYTSGRHLGEWIGELLDYDD